MSQGYKPFETIRVALAERLHRTRLYLEVDLRVGAGISSFNVDDFGEAYHDLKKRCPLRDVLKELPESGVIYVSAYSPPPQFDFLNDYKITLKDKQVVAVEDEPWSAPEKKMSSVTKEREAEARQLVQQTIQDCLSILRQSSRFKAAEDAAPKVRISFHPSRRKSYGGKNGLSFALNHFVRSEQATLREYARFASDPIIGTLSGDWKTVTKALVCHELAHWAQVDPKVVREAGLDYKAPHGDGFRAIYAYLRSRILNHSHAN